MKKIDMTNVEEAKDGFEKLPAGAYICKITAVKDISEKEYLNVSYDIAQGDYAGYYSKSREDHPDWEWLGAYVKSYKPAALPMFKRFCSAVTKSNNGYTFDGGSINSDETSLVGKKLGLLIGYEEYYGNDGDLKERAYVKSEFPIDKIGEQKVPQLKKLKEDEKKPAAADDGFLNIPDGAGDDLPFVDKK
jgi:hypothetical protein